MPAKIKHRLAKSMKNLMYARWASMKRRCHGTGKHCYHFKTYRDRGITVCDRWLNSYEAFLADMGEAPLGMQLDRIDNSKGYSPENCRWATPSTNSQNKRPPYGRKYKGVYEYRKGQFGSRIMIKVGQKAPYLGTFTCEEDAAMAYNEACIIYRGSDLYGNDNPLNKEESLV